MQITNLIESKGGQRKGLFKKGLIIVWGLLVRPNFTLVPYDSKSVIQATFGLLH